MNLLVVDEDVGAVQRADAVDDVERADDQQQDRRERRSASTSHALLPRQRPVWGSCPLEPGLIGSNSLGRQVLSKNGWSGL